MKKFVKEQKSSLKKVEEKQKQNTEDQRSLSFDIYNTSDKLLVKFFKKNGKKVQITHISNEKISFLNPKIITSYEQMHPKSMKIQIKCKFLEDIAYQSKHKNRSSEICINVYLLKKFNP